MAADIHWMREGDINVRIHTLHDDARRRLERHLPGEVFAERDAGLKDIPGMIRSICSDGHGAIEEVIVLSKLLGLRNGNHQIMPLLSETKIGDLRNAHPEHTGLLDSVEAGLAHVPKIVFTQPSFLGDEIRSVTGKGTMCFKRDATTYGPMYARETPIFLENYRRNVADGTYRDRPPQELRQAMDAHGCIRSGKSIIGGFSLTPKDKGRLSLETVWGCSRGGDLGSLILHHATHEAGDSSFYALTVRSAVANIFRAYPGMRDLGTVSALQKNGDISVYAPEHADYDTATRDPYFFWHEGDVQPK